MQKLLIRYPVLGCKLSLREESSVQSNQRTSIHSDTETTKPMHRHNIDFPPHSQDLKQVAQLFRALADETRTQLLLLLTEGEHAVSELVEKLGAPQSTISRHLGILRRAHLVVTRREGTVIRYRLGDVHVGDLVVEAFSHAEHRRIELPDHSNRRSDGDIVEPRRHEPDGRH